MTRTIPGSAATAIINGLQSKGDSGSIARWRHLDVSRLGESTESWISILSALHRCGWEEPDFNGISRDEKTVALAVHMYALSWSNANSHPNDTNIPFGRALRKYHDSIVGTTANDGIAMIRKIASASEFDQQAYLLDRLVRRMAKESNFDYSSFADDLCFLQSSSQKYNVIRRWMNDFYSKDNQ